MAYLFGDGFDCYATMADPLAGYWDSGFGVAAANTLVAGRFAGSQAVSIQSGIVCLVKASAVNDAVHHIVMAFRQTAALSGTTLGMYLQLSDAATNQCCIVFRTDGVILLTSATPAGTVLATYSGAVTAANAWTAFEFEVVINNTTGSFAVRKNGSTSNDFSAASLNTRPGANAYANKLTLGMNAVVTSQQIDDILWRSDASSVPWVGDIRCYMRMPASDASAQFARSPASVSVAQTAAFSLSSSKAANQGAMSAFTVPYSGTIASGAVSINTGGSGNMKAAIYDATRTTVLATSNAVVNPVSGLNTITFVTPLTVIKGTTYYLAVDQDFSISYNLTGATQYSFVTVYASFPAAGPGTSSASSGPTFTVNLVVASNAEMVNETLQDGTTTYVYGSTVGHADFYNLAPLGVTPASVIAVVTRGFVEKSDAGARTGAVQLKSGGTTVASSAPALSTTFGWLWRSDVVDPATSSPWTAAGVNAATIGPVVIS